MSGEGRAGEGIPDDTTCLHHTCYGGGGSGGGSAWERCDMSPPLYL